MRVRRSYGRGVQARGMIPSLATLGLEALAVCIHSMEEEPGSPWPAHQCALGRRAQRWPTLLQERVDLISNE